ncbi:unnamed protein product [Paramecium sonneborni]|uniref:Transmembrane protein n=1 Tax=Paramecium sonneborni TaxID=65129 RepID=A0A8S1RR82_9CILI|nr:unnamed protein product [Paramecium sonneborni]
MEQELHFLYQNVITFLTLIMKQLTNLYVYQKIVRLCKNLIIFRKSLLNFLNYTINIQRKNQKPQVQGCLQCFLPYPLYALFIIIKFRAITNAFYLFLSECQNHVKKQK